MAAARRLLVVDDDPMIVEMMAASLENPLWEIATASDAMTAFMKARDLRPFLILSDVQMPSYGMGTDMVKALRLEKATAATPVIVMTGMDLERAKKLLPADDPKIRLIGKPPNLDVIFGLIKELTGIDGRAAA